MVANDDALARIAGALDLSDYIPNRVVAVLVHHREIELRRTGSELCMA